MIHTASYFQYANAKTYEPLYITVISHQLLHPLWILNYQTQQLIREDGE